MMKKFWLSVLVVALAAGCDSRKATADEAAAAAAAGDAVAAATEAAEAPSAVARVNGKDITSADVDRAVDMFLKQMGGSADVPEVAAILPRIRERVVSQLIEQQILLSAADAAGVDLDEAEYADILKELESELPEGTTIAEFLAETGLTEDLIRQQMRIRKLLMGKADEAGEATEEEVRAFYDENLDAMKEEESVTASHILVQVAKDDSEEVKAEKLAKIQALRERALAGEDFAELAKENSDCPSAANGGNLGSFGRGMMVKAFEDAAFAQEPGKVGDVVESSFGYHLILVESHQEAKTHEFDEVKDRIAQMLKAQKQQEVVMGFMEGLADAAEIERFDAPEAEEEDEGEESALDILLDEEEAAEEAAAQAEEVAVEAEAAAEAAEAVAEAAEEAAVAAEAAAVAAEAELEEAVKEASEAAEEAAEEAVEEVAEPAAEAAEDISEAVEEAAEAVEEVAEPAADAAEEVSEAVEEAAEDVAEEAEAAVEAVADAVEEAAEEAAE